MRENFFEEDFSRPFYRWDQEKLQYRPSTFKEEPGETKWMVEETHAGYQVGKSSKKEETAGDFLPSTMIYPSLKVLLESDTCYVEDITGEKAAGWQTKIYRSGKQPLYAAETTRQIMARTFLLNQRAYDDVRLLGKIFGIHRNCPYVAGSMVFIPEKGASKGSTSWISLHHLTHYEANEKGTSLFFYDHPEIISPVPFRTFEKQIEKASVLFYKQNLLLYEIMKHFPVSFDPSHYAANPLVHEWLRKNSFKIRLFSAKEVFFSFYGMQCKRQLLFMFGEGDPLLVDLLRALQKYLFPYKWLGF